MRNDKTNVVKKMNRLKYLALWANATARNTNKER